MELTQKAETLKYGNQNNNFLNYSAIMKGIISFIMLCCYALGSIGGFGYSLYNKNYVIAATVAVLAYMAWPQAKEYYNKGLEPNK